MRLFHRSKEPKYDAELYQPVIKKSICTGEAAAGFVDRATGHFSEVMLICTEKDLETFQKKYGVTEPIKTIW